MKIYEIEFTRVEKIQIPEDAILPEGIDRDNIHEHVTEKIHLGAEYFGEALDLAVEAIEDMFFEGYDREDIKYDINVVKELEGVDVLNWPGEFDECNCPFCKAERIAEEDVMKVECPNPECKNILRVADNGWEGISCPECKTEIDRASLCLMGKNYKVIHIGEEK